MVLLRLSVYNDPPNFLPYSPNIVKCQLTKTGPVPTFYDQWEQNEILTEDRKRVSNVAFFYDSILTRYTEEQFFSDFLNTKETFFWNNLEQSLYIHFPLSINPQAGQLQIRVQRGYTDKSTVYIDDIEFTPQLKNVFEINKKVDNIKINKLSFLTQKCILQNGEAQQQISINNPAIGATAEYSYYDENTQEEVAIYTGFIVNDKMTTSEYAITLKDIRERENIDIPNNKFTMTEYPYLDSSLENKIIPEGYGERRSIECFPLNSKNTGSVNFKFATDATVLNSVEVLIDDVWTAKTPTATDTINGEFTLSSGDARNANGGVYKCRASVVLRSQTNPADILSDMNLRYNNIEFDDLNYNVSSWNSEKLNLSDISLYMGSKKKFYDWVELIQNGSNYGFFYDITGDGKRNIRVNLFDRPPLNKILEVENLDKVIPVERDFNNFYSTAIVKYNKNDYDNTFEEIENTDYKDDAIAQYGYENLYETESLLTSQTNAVEKAEKFLIERSTVRPVFYVEKRINSIVDFDFQIFDIVPLELKGINNREYWGLQYGKILEIKYNPKEPEKIKLYFSQVDMVEDSESSTSALDSFILDTGVLS